MRAGSTTESEYLPTASLLYYSTGARAGPAAPRRDKNPLFPFQRRRRRRRDEEALTLGPASIAGLKVGPTRHPRRGPLDGLRDERGLGHARGTRGDAFRIRSKILPPSLPAPDQRSPPPPPPASPPSSLSVLARPPARFKGGIGSATPTPFVSLLGLLKFEPPLPSLPHRPRRRHASDVISTASHQPPPRTRRPSLLAELIWVGGVRWRTRGAAA